MPDLNKNPKNIIFYHSPCIDGSTSAWAALQALGHEDTEYIGFGHDSEEYINEDLDKYVSKGCHVYFCDISPPIPALNKLLKIVNKVSIYDHHISAQKVLENFSHPKCEIVFDMNRSGAGLSWDIFNKGKPRPFLINLVEAMDLYKIDFCKTPDEFFTMAAGMDTIDVADFNSFSKEFSRLCYEDDNLKKLRGLGIKQRAIYQQRIEGVFNHMSYIACDGIDILGDSKIAIIWDSINNLSREFWYQFAKYSTHNPKILMALYDDKKGKMIAASFRSCGVVDVSLAAEEIAKKYGINGGGHARASAVRFSYKQFDKLVKKWQIPSA